MTSVEHIFNNFANGRIKADLSSTELTMELYEAHMEPFRRSWESGKDMYLTLVDASAIPEVVKVTEISGNTLTVLRGQDGTPSRLWYAGSLISQRLVSENLGEFLQKEAHRSIDYNPHGLLMSRYPGEEVLQTGAQPCQNRWFKNVGGTNWRLIAGEICLNEQYDEDGYVIAISNDLILIHFDTNPPVDTALLHNITEATETDGGGNFINVNHKVFGAASLENFGSYSQPSVAGYWVEVDEDYGDMAEFTMEAWVKCVGTQFIYSNSAVGSIMHQFNGGDGQFNFILDFGIYSKKVSINFCVGYRGLWNNISADLFRLYEVTDYVERQWHHAAVTRDSNNVIRLFWDGVKVKEGTYAGKIGENAPIAICWPYFAAHLGFDEVRLRRDCVWIDDFDVPTEAYVGDFD